MARQPGYDMRDPEEEISFGAELFRLRTLLGLSQSQVADTARMARGYYSLLENSRRVPPPLETVAKIATAMNMAREDMDRLCEKAVIERLRRKGHSNDADANLLTCLYVIRDGRAIRVSGEKQKRITSILDEEKE